MVGDPSVLGSRTLRWVWSIVLDAGEASPLSLSCLPLSSGDEAMKRCRRLEDDEKKEKVTHQTVQTWHWSTFNDRTDTSDDGGTKVSICHPR